MASVRSRICRKLSLLKSNLLSLKELQFTSSTLCADVWDRALVFSSGCLELATALLLLPPRISCKYLKVRVQIIHILISYYSQFQATLEFTSQCVSSVSVYIHVHRFTYITTGHMYMFLVFFFPWWVCVWGSFDYLKHLKSISLRGETWPLILVYDNAMKEISTDKWRLLKETDLSTRWGVWAAGHSNDPRRGSGTSEDLSTRQLQRIWCWEMRRRGEQKKDVQDGWTGAPQWELQSPKGLKILWVPSAQITTENLKFTQYSDPTGAPLKRQST